MIKIPFDWKELYDQFDWIRAMSTCRQDPIHHAEGDVLTHTKMVCEEITQIPGFERKPYIFLMSALLHDIAKPICFKEENGRITAKHHSAKGAIIARKILWEMNIPFKEREEICWLIRHHMKPFHMFDFINPTKKVIEISTNSSCHDLSILATADTNGKRPIGDIGLVQTFIDYCQEQNCFSNPYPFHSSHSRFTYFNRDNWTPDNQAFQESGSHVYLMSGLPASGKNYFAKEYSSWIKKQFSTEIPIINLDDIRHKLKIKPTDPQHQVIEHAYEIAYDYLRKKQDFIWNATNISKFLRSEIISLFKIYNAQINIIYVETSKEKLFERNRARKEPVPNSVIEKLLTKWEIPDLTECHELTIELN